MIITRPTRRRHQCHQTWKGTVNSVFPLLCPVKEVDWIPGWEPSLVISESGVMENNCIFLEPEEEKEAIWIVTAYEKNRCLDMYRILPGVAVSRFTIHLQDNGDSSNADISYEHTALGQPGHKLIDEFTEERFIAFMGQFEKAINHYLITGTKIET